MKSSRGILLGYLERYFKPLLARAPKPPKSINKGGRDYGKLTASEKRSQQHIFDVLYSKGENLKWFPPQHALDISL